MSLVRGVIGALGIDPDWSLQIKDSQGALIRSLLALIIIPFMIWGAASAVEMQRGVLTGQDVTSVSLISVGLLSLLWLASFFPVSGAVAMLMRKTTTLHRWWITRNWAVVGLSVILGAAAGLHRLGAPFALLNAVLFSAYFGLLLIDIRLAQRVGGYALGAAVLIGCIVVGVGLSVVLFAMLNLMGS